MFARFRDENASIDTGFGLPGAVRAAGEAAGFDYEDSTGKTFHSLTLTCGRRLAWSEFGHPHGYPILYMHRQGGCRLDALFLHDAAKAAGFRLIAVDRPGLGGSDFLSYSKPAELVDDYRQLLDYLRLPKVAVFSWGAGSQFALAMAGQLPHRISFLNLLSPVEHQCRVSGNRAIGAFFRLALRALLVIRTGRGGRDSARYLERWREQLSYSDKKVTDDPEVRLLLARIARESAVQGTAGLVQDIWLGLTTNELDNFDLVGLSATTPVHIWGQTRISIADLSERDDAKCGSGLVREPAHNGDVQRKMIRHRVSRRGQFFIRQMAQDIFGVARRTVGLPKVDLTPGNVDLLLR